MQGVAGAHLALAALLVVFLLLPGNLPRLRSGEHLGNAAVLAGLLLMIVLQVVVGLRTWVLAYFAARACDPVPMPPPAGTRVAVLTTIVPGKEPVELVMTTLRAMKRVRHDGPLDVWLLDEGDDPEVRRRCEEIGVRHFSRKGNAEWNQPSGQFRQRTKHGNHNAWRAAHEADYDVVAQMDPDHVPYPNFLERTLGYFADPDTAFVVAPQVYANIAESFVARGAAISMAPMGRLLTVAAATRVRRGARSYSVAEQRRIGQRLIEQGLITVQQLEELLDLQATSEAAWQRLGDLAVQQGYIDARQLSGLRPVP